MGFLGPSAVLCWILVGVRSNVSVGVCLSQCQPLRLVLVLVLGCSAGDCCCCGWRWWRIYKSRQSFTGGDWRCFFWV